MTQKLEFQKSVERKRELEREIESLDQMILYLKNQINTYENVTNIENRNGIDVNNMKQINDVPPAERKNGRGEKKVPQNQMKERYIMDENFSKIQQQQEWDDFKKLTSFSFLDDPKKTDGDTNDLSECLILSKPITNDIKSLLLKKNKKLNQLMGDLFHEGLEKDIEVGLAFLHEAHDNGNIDASILLLNLYTNQEYKCFNIAPNPNLALKIIANLKSRQTTLDLTPFIRNAVLLLAHRHYRGQQYASAKTLFEQLADNHGLLEAYYYLALFNIEGRNPGMIKSTTRAKSYLLKIQEYFDKMPHDEIESYASKMMNEKKQDLISMEKLKKMYQAGDYEQFYIHIYQEYEIPFCNFLLKNAFESDRFQPPPFGLKDKPNIQQIYEKLKRPYILGLNDHWQMENEFFIDMYLGTKILYIECLLKEKSYEEAMHLIKKFPFSLKPNDMRYDFIIASYLLFDFPPSYGQHKKSAKLLHKMLKVKDQSKNLLQQIHHSLGYYYWTFGEGERDVKKSLYHYHCATQLDYYPSMLHLMSVYAFGNKNTSKNMKLAVYYFKKIQQFSKLDSKRVDDIFNHYQKWKLFVNKGALADFHKANIKITKDYNIWENKRTELHMFLVNRPRINQVQEKLCRRELLNYESYALDMIYKSGVTILLVGYMYFIPLSGWSWFKKSLSSGLGTGLTKIKNILMSKK